MKYFHQQNQTCTTLDELNDVCTQKASSLSSSGSVCCYYTFEVWLCLLCCEIPVIFQHHNNFQLCLGTRSSVGLNLADPENGIFEDEARIGHVVPGSGPDGDEIEACKARLGFISSNVVENIVLDVKESFLIQYLDNWFMC